VRTQRLFWKRRKRISLIEFYSSRVTMCFGMRSQFMVVQFGMKKKKLMEL
jgi:hypothetical protein